MKIMKKVPEAKEDSKKLTMTRMLIGIMTPVLTKEAKAKDKARPQPA
jgi:hypothetical protein